MPDRDFEGNDMELTRLLVSHFTPAQWQKLVPEDHPVGAGVRAPVKASITAWSSPAAAERRSERRRRSRVAVGLDPIGGMRVERERQRDRVARRKNGSR